MATAWVKSLQCKSRAYDDVFSPSPRNLIASSSCRHSSRNIKDVVDTSSSSAANHHHRRKLPKSRSHKPNLNPKPNTRPDSFPAQQPRRHSRTQSNPETTSLYPALTELPEGHPSRNVVEIIFQSSWSERLFSGRIEMIFKVQNGSRTSTRFEEYREVVKSRAGFSGGGGGTWEENARCVADGNEMMRFYCLGPAGGVGDTRGSAWVFPGGKGSAICTFSGSGAAHESAGGGKGRRAMLVCRVVAGRVWKQLGVDSVVSEDRVGFDSVSGERNGELLVFDNRAVLPCFLIIYKL